MFKSLSFKYYGQAVFVMVTDPSVESAALRLDDTDFSGDVSDKAAIQAFLDARLPEPPAGRYEFTKAVPASDLKFGAASEIETLPPPRTHYFIVAVVPRTPTALATAERSSVDLQLQGFDEIAGYAKGALRAAVHVDESAGKAHVRVYAMDADGASPRYGEAFKSAAAAYESVVEQMPIKWVARAGASERAREGSERELPWFLCELPRFYCASCPFSLCSPPSPSAPPPPLLPVRPRIVPVNGDSGGISHFLGA
jgi:hypothetical protein